jgi:cell division protein FtsB
VGTRTRGRRGRQPRGLRRLLISDVPLFALLLAAIAGAALLLTEPFENYLDGRARVALLEEQAAALEAQNLQLEQRIEDLDDPLNIELLAREQQGLIRPGEVPYVLIPPEADRPRIVDAPAPAQVDEDDLLTRLLAVLRRVFG